MSKYAEYTNDDWAKLISEIESNLTLASTPYPVAKPGSPEFAKYIDHTVLKLDATEDQITKLCEEAKASGFASVCIRLPWAPHCRTLLTSTPIAWAVTVGFHEGTAAPSAKASETTAALQTGAQEVDVVFPYHLLVASASSPPYTEIFAELSAVRKAAGDVKVKYILETSQLSDTQRVAASVLALAAGADMIKTSTGFNGRGASVEDVRVMRAVIEAARERGVVDKSRLLEVKASGGIRSLGDAVKMVEAGATRIGTSSGMAIMEGSA